MGALMNKKCEAIIKKYQESGLINKDELISQLELIIKHKEIDLKDLENLIETLTLFQKAGISKTINQETITLIIKLLDNEKYFDKSDYKILPLVLKIILFPQSLVSYKQEKLGDYLLSLENIMNWMIINLDEQDLIVIDKYNHDLFNILSKYQSLLNEYEESAIHIYEDLSMVKIITTALSHLVLLLYLNISEYDHNYDLLENVFCRIIENYYDFLFDCHTNNYFMTDYNEENLREDIIRDFMLCKRLLDKEFCPPIKSYKKEDL